MAPRDPPPMTSRETREVYLRSMRGPKLSRAEQMRNDWEEEQREREEAAQKVARERARAARERKRQREEQQRQERKSKGLPLVDARASQDTIARFARVRPRDVAMPAPMAAVPEEEHGVAGDAEAAPCPRGKDCCQSSPDPPSKRPRSAEVGQREEKAAPPPPPPPPPPPVAVVAAPVARSPPNPQPATNPVAQGQDRFRELLGFESSQEFGEDFDTLFPTSTQLMREIDAEGTVGCRGPVKAGSSKSGSPAKGRRDGRRIGVDDSANPATKSHVTLQSGAPSSDDFFLGSQDLQFLVESLEEAATQKEDPGEHIRRLSHASQSPAKDDARGDAGVNASLFSSQFLELSSQDLLDIEGPGYQLVYEAESKSTSGVSQAPPLPQGGGGGGGGGRSKDSPSTTATSLEPRALSDDAGADIELCVTASGIERHPKNQEGEMTGSYGAKIQATAQKSDDDYECGDLNDEDWDSLLA